jgi:hypothetical protein
MKTLITLIAFALLSAVSQGADPTTFTIAIPPADVPRIAEAFGSILNLGRPATPDEVEQAAIVWLNQQTTDYERRKNMTAFSPPPLQVVPGPTATPGTKK